VLQFCTAYPHFHSNGSAMKREHSPWRSRGCCNPLVVELPTLGEGVGNEHEGVCPISCSSVRNKCICSERAAEGRGPQNSVLTAPHHGLNHPVYLRATTGNQIELVDGRAGVKASNAS
jgi:hypothetical protein